MENTKINNKITKIKSHKSTCKVTYLSTHQEFFFIPLSFYSANSAHLCCFSSPRHPSFWHFCGFSISFPEKNLIYKKCRNVFLAGDKYEYIFAATAQLNFLLRIN